MNIYILILIVLIIIGVHYYIFSDNNDSIECYDNTEAIQNLASMYNSDQITTSNILVTGTGAMQGDLNVSGSSTFQATTMMQNMTLNSDMTLNGNLNMTGNIIPSSTSILDMANLKTGVSGVIIGNNPYGNVSGTIAPDVIMQQRDYIINSGVILSGNLGSYQFATLDEAKRACKAITECDKIIIPYGATFPTSVILGSSAGYNSVISSSRWPREISMIGFTYGGIGNGQATNTTATSYDDCYNQCANSSSCDYFQYDVGASSYPAQCSLYTPNTAAGGNTYYHIKKY